MLSELDFSVSTGQWLPSMTFIAVDPMRPALIPLLPDTDMIIRSASLDISFRISQGAPSARISSCFAQALSAFFAALSRNIFPSILDI